MKKFYRVGSTTTTQGLWYDMQGNFTGLIHDKFSFCKNKDLLMPYDEDLIDWLSATDSLEDLFNWFTREDIKKLSEFGYSVLVYETDDFKQYKNHLVINKQTSKLLEKIEI